MPLLIVSQDFDDTSILALKDNNNNPFYQANRYKPPIDLWCRSSPEQRKIIITTHRNAGNYAKLILDKHFEVITLSHYLKRYKEWDITIEKIIADLDPLQEGYAEELLALENEILTSLRPTLLEQSKSGIFNLVAAKNTKATLEKTWAEVIEKIQKSKDFLSFKEKVELKDKEIKKINPQYDEANVHKIKELRYAFQHFLNLFPDAKIKMIHIDDSKRIKAGLDEAKKQADVDEEKKFLNNVIPVLCDLEDNKYEWQRTVAAHIGLEEAAKKVLYGVKTLENIVDNDFGRLAILLYLHQNKDVYMNGNDTTKTVMQNYIQILTQNFAEKVKKQTSLKLVPELIEYIKLETGVDFKPVASSVWLNVFSYVHFWSRSDEQQSIKEASVLKAKESRLQTLLRTSKGRVPNIVFNFAETQNSAILSISNFNYKNDAELCCKELQENLGLSLQSTAILFEKNTYTLKIIMNDPITLSTFVGLFKKNTSNGKLEDISQHDANDPSLIRRSHGNY